MLTPNVAPRPVHPRRLFAVLVALLLIVTFVQVAPSRASSADGELLPNPAFANGTEGWRTNGSAQKLSVLSGGMAQLTTTSTQSATLNDKPNAVQSTAKGTSYIVSARVRTTTPTVKGALRIREVSGGNAVSSQTSFTLDDRNWSDVTLEVTTKYAESHFDFNLVAWNLPRGKNLQIDAVSVKLATEVPTTPPAPPTPPGPTTPPAPNPPPVGACDETPPAGTLFGTNVSTIDQSLSDALSKMDSTFGRVKVARQFDPGLPFSWDSRKAELLKGRTLVTSFKVPPAEIISGKHDAFFRTWFETAPTDQTIYWSYFHEPENNISNGEYTVEQYRAAWTRLAKIADEACKPNMYATLILTGWTMNPGSKRDYRVYDAGADFIDVLAFDPYNFMYDTERTYYEPVDAMFEHIVSKMNVDGRPWGIAETGSRLVGGDADGAKRAAWLREMGTHLTQQKALFVTYFNSIGTNDYRLLDSNSIAAWKSNVAR